MPVSAITNPNLTRSDMPAITLTEAISLADLENQYRERYFLDDSSTEEWLNRYPGSSFMQFGRLNGEGRELTSMRAEWNEFSRLPTATQLSVEVNASATNWTVDDPGVANVGQYLKKADGEMVRVVERALSGTVSGGGNMKVARAQGGTIATAHSAGTSFMAFTQVMGEKDVPRMATGVMPGRSQYNLAMIFGRKDSETVLNANSEIKGDWGKLKKQLMFAAFELEIQVGHQALFGPRWIDHSNPEIGPVYFTGGATHFIETNVLTLEDDPTRHTWEIYDAFYANLFANDATGPYKVAFDGRRFFNAHKKLARQLGTYEQVGTDVAKLGHDDFVFNSEYGPVRHVLSPFDLPHDPRYGLSDWSVVIDPQHYETGYYRGFSGIQVVPDVEEKLQAITVNSVAHVGSFWQALKHESTHGIVIGAPKQMLELAETL